MNIAALFEPADVVSDFDAHGTKHILQALASHAAAWGGPDTHAVFDALREREKIGSFAIGCGVALPHARVPNIEKCRGVVLRLCQPLSLDAPDSSPIDLVVGLFSPFHRASEHARLLADLSRYFTESTLVEEIRKCVGKVEILRVLGHDNPTRAH